MARTVAVFGSSSVVEGMPEYEEARRLGGLLARAGHAVLNGGQRGTMDAVARGCAESGGSCLGITVRNAPWGPPTAHAREVIELESLNARMEQLLMRADAWFALPGQVGTLAEVATAWALLAAGLVEPRPLVLVGAPWRQAIGPLAAALGIRPELVRLITLAASPEEAVRCLAS